MRFPLSTCLLLPLYLSSLLADAENGSVKSVNLPKIEPVRLEAIARIQNDAITESSGIVRSRHHAGIYWTHNDSGDTARIFSLRLDGTSHNPREPDRPYGGILFLDAGNVDWEDIATDDRGNLIIGAFGNNANARRDLAVYLFPEPVPYVGPGRSLILKKIPFHFPIKRHFRRKTEISIAKPYSMRTGRFISCRNTVPIHIPSSIVSTARSPTVQIP